MPLFRDGECPPLERWNEGAQIVFFAGTCLAASTIAGLVFSGMGIDHALTSICRNGFSDHLFGAIIRALCTPFLESFIGIWLPLFFMRVLKREAVVRIGFAAVIYAILHLTDGFLVFFSSLITGWILASGFIFCQQTSWIKAFRVVSISSALHNAVLLLVYQLWLK